MEEEDKLRLQAEIEAARLRREEKDEAETEREREQRKENALQMARSVRHFNREVQTDVRISVGEKIAQVVAANGQAKRHPLYRNVTADQALVELRGKEVGEIILRPSSAEGCIAVTFVSRIGFNKSLIEPLPVGWKLLDAVPVVKVALL